MCAGASIYRRNVCKRLDDPAALKLPADKKLVFASPPEFIGHHSKVPPVEEISRHKKGPNSSTPASDWKIRDDPDFAEYEPKVGVTVLSDGAIRLTVIDGEQDLDTKEARAMADALVDAIAQSRKMRRKIS